MANNKIKLLKSKINELLNEHRTAKGQTDFTHVSLGGLSLPGKFTFNDKQKRKLLNRYLGKAIDYKLNYSIAEIPKEYGPIKVDIDLRLPKEDEIKRIYDNKMVIELINIYRDCIKKYCKLTNNEITCFLFEKDKASEKNGEIKDGFHLIFPYITLNYKLRHLIINDVIKITSEKNMFDHFCNPNVIDCQVVSSNPWLMYGCSKPNNSCYKISNIYDYENKTIDIDTLGKSSEIVKLLSLRENKWSETNETLLQKTISDESIHDSYKLLGIENTNDTNQIENIIPEDKYELIEKAIKLVDMLSNKRSDSYHNWIRVGWALHNTDKSLVDTWITFSKKSKKFIEGDCDKRWKNMRDGGYTIRSLMLWAKEDNPDEYTSFIKQDFENILKKNAINNTFMIARALHCKYLDRFVCVNPKDNMWYHYREHRWRKCSNGGSLITLMSSDFANYYCNAAQEANMKAMEVNGPDKKKFIEEASLFNKIADNLMDINFKERLMKEARYIFFDEDFLERLDENRNLIGFENGVYDLKLRKFRGGQPDDHLSMSTGVHYIKWSEKNPYNKPIHDFFTKVLTNKNVREYFLSRLSSCVSGENREEKFYFCTGSGSNGKSLTFQLVSEALGDYYISCPITIITRKRGASNAASPELARLKGPRVGVFQEPGADEQLNVGIFKELSGNDRFMVRGLYKEPIEVRPQLKYWLACNDLPKVPSNDGGTWRRVEVFDFASKFVEDPDPDNKNEFKIDETLKEKIQQWAPALCSYLINRFITEYDTENKIVTPSEVKLSTNRYRQDQDVLREYFDGSIEITNDKKDNIKKRDLWTHFKLWFKDVHDGDALPKNKKLYEFIEKELKREYKHNGWTGIMFKNDVSDSDDNNNNDLDI